MLNSPTCRVGKSYIIGSTITAHYFYPKGEDGSEGELTDLPRPVVKGEDPPWVLVDGTPGGRRSSYRNCTRNLKTDFGSNLQ